MAQAFSYRAVLADGTVSSGTIEAGDSAAALASLRRSGARPIVVAPLSDSPIKAPKRANGRIRVAVNNLIAELATLIDAGLPLDRALGLAIGNVEDRALAAALGEVLADVREGVPLSRAMARRPALFGPTAAAMTEAGEANGALGTALKRLAVMLESAEDLRRTIGTAMIYPIALLVIAVGVILMMLLFVVPQFESLFDQAKGNLPAASLLVMQASHMLRDWGIWLLLGLVLAILGLRQLLRRPSAALALDRLVLVVPQLGKLVRHIECARFARTLGVLVEGNVALPDALHLARRTVANRVIGDAIATVADGVREGGGLAAPLAATKVLPPVAIGLVRTGEETSQLGAMLLRLADMLDRDVRVLLQRAIGLATPLITIVLGATVAAIIAAIMSAIIGFNDLAIAS